MQHSLYQGEIWTQSRCLEQENDINQSIYQLLESIGFRSTDDSRRWQRGNHTVIVCLVDDIRSCSQDYHCDLPHLFDANTTVITDNYITCPTQFQVIHLPTSFLGIYHYVPADESWNPDRDFAFAVNRIDHRRFLLMLEVGLRVHLHLGYVNFNCRHHTEEIDHNTAMKNWANHWEHVGPEDKEKYQKSYELLTARIPIRNYDIEHDDIFLKSYLTMVVETYNSDNNISLSEKIFRALVTPAPWTVSSGRYTVAYLDSLGFDTVSDLIDHNHYDRLIEFQDKTRIFVWKSLQAIKTFKSQELSLIQERYQCAARHNQRLLANMARAWPGDFVAWQNKLKQTLAS
jgi:hypothetical protein